MDILSKVRRFQTSVPMLGLKETLRTQIAHLFGYDPAKDRSFDKRYKTDTTAIVRSGDLGIAEEETRRAAVLYVSCPPRFERHILRTLGVSYKDFDFVDMGCGKGRVLMIASEWPFRSVTGIEISEALCAIAEKNLQVFKSSSQKCSKVSVHSMDARAFPIYNNNTVFHFYHPFQQEILRPILERIASCFQDSNKKAIIVYIRKEIQDLFPVFDEFRFTRLRHVQSLNSRYQYAVFSQGHG